MDDGFGGAAMFNRGSPSSYQSCVDRIVKAYIQPGRPARILDIGGTDWGFRKRAVLPPRSRVVIANPEAGVGADYAYVDRMPPHEGNFDLAMIFGVLMYLERDELLKLLCSARMRLRGGGVLLIAEPNPKSPTGYVESGLKIIGHKIFGHKVRQMRKYVFYSKTDTMNILLEAGFGEASERDDLRPHLVLLPYYMIAAKNGASAKP